MKQRESHKTIISPIALERMARNECPACGLPKAQWKRSKTWTCCSKKCTKKYNNEYRIWGWGELRSKVFMRDNYTCNMCNRKPTIEGWAGIVPDDTKLIADHIIPIALGGEQWDMENIQTLCDYCNKIKTAEDRKKIDEQRKIEKVLIPSQTIL